MKRIACGILAVGVLLLSAAYPADAWRDGGVQHGGFQHGGIQHGGFPQRGFHHGGFHHGVHRHVFVGGGAFLGVPSWLGPWYPYPYYSTPPVIVQQTPPVYIEQSPPGQAAYWYYCQQAKAYYPYVKECPGGWMTVVPPAAAPGQ